MKFKFSEIINKTTAVFPAIILTCIVLLSSCNKHVSITPPDEPPPDGYVFIDSYPKDFHILLDGKERRRTTPDSLTWLTTGSYVLTLKKDLFHDTSFTIDIVEGEKKSVFVDFSRNPGMRGQIFCDSYPEGATIYINDSSTGILTPATLSDILPGYYEIRYHLNKYRDDSVSIAVSSGNLSSTKSILVDTTLWRDYTTTNSSIPTNSLTSVAVDVNNLVWIGTSDQGAFSFNGSAWRAYNSANSFLPDNYINCIAVNQSGSIFFGTNRGFAVLTGSQMEPFGYMTSGLVDYHVYAFGFTDPDDWFIGTQGGLTESFTANNSRTWHTYDQERVPDPWITAITTDNSGNLWIGLKNSGVVRRNSNSAFFTFNRNNSNLMSDNVTAIAASPNGDIWTGFEKNSVFGNGLSYYHSGSWLTVYPIPTGSKTYAIVIDKNNRKWVATDQGLVTFINPSDATTYNYENTGLHLDKSTGVALDAQGNVWISTGDGGLIEHIGK